MPNYKNSSEDIIDKISTNELFDNFAVADFRSFMKQTCNDYVVLPANTVIRSDVFGKSIVGLIIDGVINLECVDKSGRVLSLYSIGSGQSIGAFSIFGYELLPLFYYKTKKKSNILFVSASSLLVFCAENPKFQLNFTELFLKRTQKLLNVISILHNDNIRDKFTKYVATEICPEQPTFKVPISKSEVAAKLGVTRTSFYRELKKMKDDKLVDIADKQVTVSQEMFNEVKSYNQMQFSQSEIINNQMYSRDRLNKLRFFTESILISDMSQGVKATAVHCKVITDENGAVTDGIIITISDAFAEGLHLSPESIIGKRVRQLFPSIDPKMIDLFGRVAITGNREKMLRFSKKHNAWFDLLIYSKQYPYFSVISQNISQTTTFGKQQNRIKCLQKRVLNYRGLNTQLKGCLNTILHGVICADVKDNITFINNKSKIFRGVSDRVVGKQFGDVFETYESKKKKKIYPMEDGQNLLEIAQDNKFVYLKSNYSLTLVKINIIKSGKYAVGILAQSVQRYKTHGALTLAKKKTL